VEAATRTSQDVRVGVDSLFPASAKRDAGMTESIRRNQE